jgi:hypothetical protein
MNDGVAIIRLYAIHPNGTILAEKDDGCPEKLPDQTK